MKPFLPVFLWPMEWGVTNCDSHTPFERNGDADTDVRHSNRPRVLEPMMAGATSEKPRIDDPRLSCAYRRRIVGQYP